MIKFSVFKRWWSQKRHLSMATLPTHTTQCPCCGLESVVPQMSQGESANCPQCGQLLVKINRNPYTAPLAFVSAAWILMLLVGSQLYLSMDMIGVSERLSVTDIFQNLKHHEYGFLATVMLLLVFFTPVLFMSMYMYVHIALYRQQYLPGLNTCARHMIRLRPWLMVDVFFVATLVALVKIAAVSNFTIGPAFGFVFVYALFLIHMGININPHWLFYQLSQLQTDAKPLCISQQQPNTLYCTRCLHAQHHTDNECDVCGAFLYRRIPNSIQKSLALLITAIILFIPANMFIMMSTDSLINSAQSNIFDGVLILWKEKDHLVAVIVFIASILIPVLKILLLMILLYSARFKPLLPPKVLNKMYHFVEFIGRWSMIDIFVIILLMAVYRTNIASVTPGMASVYFTLVIFATMLSAEVLDLRLIWDRHQQQRAKSHANHRL